MPVKAGWDFTYLLAHGTRCVDVYTFLYVSAALNIATDLAVCILPLPIIIKLRVRKGKKFVLIVLFGFGVL